MVRQIALKDFIESHYIIIFENRTQELTIKWRFII